MAKPDTWRGPNTATIGTSMGECVAHPLDPPGIDRLGRAAMEDPRNSAHAEFD